MSLLELFVEVARRVVEEARPAFLSSTSCLRLSEKSQLRRSIFFARSEEWKSSDENPKVGK